jgi:hypothetical protein
MTTSSIDATQQRAARVAGFLYLAIMAIANFGQVYVPSKLFVPNDAAKTALNIMATERLFRLGIASDLLTWAGDIVLIVALYVILKSVNRNLALLALSWRLVETAILAVVTLHGFDVLGLLSGAAYLREFEADRLQALTMLSIGAHAAGYNIGLMFFGLGSTVFSYLFFKSNYIPRILSALGVFASLVVAICTFAFVIFPNFALTAEPACYMPIFLFELIAGFWLLIKGIRHPGPVEPGKASGSNTGQ